MITEKAFRQVVCICLLFIMHRSGIALAATVRIMPLGDSITVGIGDGTNGGYRGPLYQKLTDAGHTVDFVGGQTGGTIPDPQHEGHSGWRADQIRDNILGWLMANPAEIVLLHIGTNDITQGELAPGITTEIGQILDNIHVYEAARNVNIHVVLARIINRSTPNGTLGLETSRLNNSIGAMAAQRILNGERLIVVDHESALIYPGDLVDTVHPNAGGYGKMATVWFDALHALLCPKAEFISDTIPSTMAPGTSYGCDITMKNSGCQWSCSSLGTCLTVGQINGPVACKLIPCPYYTIYTNPCVVDSGQNCVFPFAVNVPTDTPFGEYELSWQMKDKNIWFDGIGHNAVFRKTVMVTSSTVTITQQPVAQLVCPGNMASFAVVATGNGTLVYQWRKDGVELSNDSHYSGVNDPMLTITDVTVAHAGQYRCAITDNGGMLYSNQVALSLRMETSLVTQPQPASVFPGTGISFSVVATGEGTIGYQWQKNGENLTDGDHYSGVSTANLAISNVTTAEGGEYRCVVTAGCGSAISDTALLTVRSYPYYTGDFDDDGDVDQDDFGWFQNCLGREAEPACAPANLNGLGAIDWSDFSKFRACMSGSAIYPPSNCVK